MVPVLLPEAILVAGNLSVRGGTWMGGRNYGVGDHAARPRHRILGGASLQVDAEGFRWYSISCSCGWQSEACNSAALADAAGEQHLTLSSRRRSTSHEV
jgi:hypothetical protein